MTMQGTVAFKACDWFDWLWSIVHVVWIYEKSDFIAAGMKTPLRKHVYIFFRKNICSEDAFEI